MTGAVINTLLKRILDLSIGRLGTIRETLEQLSRGITFRRRLPQRYGEYPIKVTPECGLKYWRLSLEKAKPELFQWVDWHVSEGDVVWDIGANLGLFSFGSLVKSGTSGTVVAVEPDPWLVSLMEETLAFWPERYTESLSIISAVISDRRGSVELGIAQRSRSANHIEDVKGSQSAGGIRERVTVRSLTLDDLLSNSMPPDVVKIDVEGAEDLVLRGGTSIVEKTRPTFIVEVAEQNRDDVKKYFKEASYWIYNAEVKIEEQKHFDSMPFNIVAVPEEKMD